MKCSDPEGGQHTHEHCYESAPPGVFTTEDWPTTPALIAAGLHWQPRGEYQEEQE